jgi:hypothetical protein
MKKKDREKISEAMRLLRSIPSEARAKASRENGKKGGRPKLRDSCDMSQVGERDEEET